MEIDPSEMSMETANLSRTEWLEKFIIISKEELDLSKKSSDDKKSIGKVLVSIRNDEDEDDDDNEDGTDDHDYQDCEDNDDDNYYYYKDFDDDDSDSDDDDDDYTDDDDDNYKIRYSKIQKAQYDLRMIRMGPLFASQPRLKKICKDWENNFLRLCFTTYIFVRNKKDSVNELHEKANDLEYLLNLCGTNLTSLDVTQYPTSQMMPIINVTCPNLEELYLGFKEIMSQDFENVFSKMSHLKRLTIKWQCENTTLPMTLAKSLEQIDGTLESLYLSCTVKRNDIFSPDPLASVFPRLIALKDLTIYDFGLSQLLLQSISQMKNLTGLSLWSCWPNNHPMLDTRINMHPIGYLKNLERLHIECDYGVGDEFLINLCNNAKKLSMLHIIGTNITDIGMSAINNLEQLEWFDLKLFHNRKKNDFITDESIQCLFNQKLRSFNISNCFKITDKGVLKLVENLPNLGSLFIKNTKVTRGAVRKIHKLSKHRKKSLCVY